MTVPSLPQSLGSTQDVLRELSIWYRRRVGMILPRHEQGYHVPGNLCIRQSPRECISDASKRHRARWDRMVWKSSENWDTSAKRRDRIDLYEPRKTNQVAHGADCEVSHKVHTTRVDLIDSIPPVIESAPMRIKDSEIEGRIALATKLTNRERSKGRSTYCRPATTY
jgi:hypothetical protein